MEKLSLRSYCKQSACDTKYSINQQIVYWLFHWACNFERLSEDSFTQTTDSSKSQASDQPSDVQRWLDPPQNCPLDLRAILQESQVQLWLFIQLVSQDLSRVLSGVYFFGMCCCGRSLAQGRQGLLKDMEETALATPYLCVFPPKTQRGTNSPRYPYTLPNSKLFRVNICSVLS